MKLLHRTTRKVNVTADGAAYYQRVVRLLADLDDAETSLSAASASPRGRLRVDVPAPLASLVLVPALPDFNARYPDIQINLGASDRKVDLIDENVDCVVRGGELTDLSLRARHVADLPLGVYASPAYLARTGMPTHPLALEDAWHHIVGYRNKRTGHAGQAFNAGTATQEAVADAASPARKHDLLFFGASGGAGLSGLHVGLLCHRQLG